MTSSAATPKLIEEQLKKYYETNLSSQRTAAEPARKIAKLGFKQ
jgi:hypothetical protein